MVTGFPSPAQGYECASLDLNRELIKHPVSTVVMTVSGSRYTNMSIYNGDLLVIDRAKKVLPNSLVVYESGGQFVLGRAFNIKEESIITGVITYVIHKVKEV